MSDEKKVALGQDVRALKALYQLSIENRNFEINQLGQRNNFLMIFQGVLLAGLTQSAGANIIVGPNFLKYIVCLTGLLISVYQFWIGCGAKFWQIRWEIAVSETEKRLISKLKMYDEEDRQEYYDLFSRPLKDVVLDVEQELKSVNGKLSFIDKQILKKPSVSKVPIYVAMSLCIAWSILLAFYFDWISFFIVLSNMFESFKSFVSMLFTYI